MEGLNKRTLIFSGILAFGSAVIFRYLKKKSRKSIVRYLGKLNNVYELEYNPSKIDLFIGDRQNVKKKLQILRESGPDNFHVAIDFDMTITSFKTSKGERNNTSYHVLAENNILSSNCLKDMHHYNVEFLEIMNYFEGELEEKYRLLNELDDKFINRFIKENVSASDLYKIIENKEFAIRAYFRHFYELIEDKKIQISIVSAGAAECVNTVLENHVHISKNKNAQIIANEFHFNKFDIIDRVNKVTYPNDKHDALIKTYRKYPKNSIVIGDHLGDAHIVDNVSNGEILKIGYLKDSQQLDSYLKEFDIVIFGEGDYLLPYNIIKYVVGEEIDIKMVKSDYEKEIMNIFNK